MLSTLRAVSRVILHYHQRLQYKKKHLIIPVVSSFILKKIKLNNISIYKRQVFFLVFYKISLKIYCHFSCSCPPMPSNPTFEKNSERVSSHSFNMNQITYSFFMIKGFSLISSPLSSNCACVSSCEKCSQQSLGVICCNKVGQKIQRLIGAHQSITAPPTACTIPKSHYFPQLRSLRS